MDANNEFDKLIKDKLAKGTQQVPSELKAAIESRLVKEGLIKKGSGNNRKWLFFSLSVIAILAILAGGYNYVNKTSIVESGPSKIESNEVSMLAGSSKNTASKITDNSEVELSKENETNLSKIDDDKEIKSSSIPESETGEEKSELKPKATEVLSIKNDVKRPSSDLADSKPDEMKSALQKSNNSGARNLVKSKEKSDKKLSGKNSQQTSVLETNNETKASDESLIASRNNISGESKNSDKNRSQVSESVSDDNVEKGKEESQNILPVSEVNSSVGKDLSDAKRDSTIDASQPNETVAPLAQTNENVANTEKVKSDSLFSDSLNTESKISAVPANDSLKTDSTFSSRFAVEIFAGLQFTMKQGLATSGSSGGTSGTKNSELIAGLKLNYFINNFTLGAGVNISKHSSQVPTVYTTYYQDTSSILIPVSLAATFKTDYSIIDIPILIGYNFQMNKFAIHVESGISFSLISSTTSVLSIDNSNYVINNFNSISTEKSYTNYVGQVSFLYSLSRKFQLMVQPSFNYGLTGVFKQLPDEKINVFSLKAGLRFKF